MKVMGVRDSAYKSYTSYESDFRGDYPGPITREQAIGKMAHTPAKGCRGRAGPAIYWPLRVLGPLWLPARERASKQASKQVETCL